MRWAKERKRFFEGRPPCQHTPSREAATLPPAPTLPGLHKGYDALPVSPTPTHKHPPPTHTHHPPRQVFTKGMKAVVDLQHLSKQLRSLPYVEPQLPTLALVGAPNVGKSSLVQVRARCEAGWRLCWWLIVCLKWVDELRKDQRMNRHIS